MVPVRWFGVLSVSNLCKLKELKGLEGKSTFLSFLWHMKMLARVAATCIYHLYLICSLFHKELFFLIVTYIYIVCNSLQKAFLYINSFILTTDE